MYYISLGHACQVAHQLKRLGLAQETMFYDWLVTQHDRLVESLDFSFIDKLFREGYKLPTTGNYLTETGTGLSFYPHDFRGLPEKDTLLIDSQIDDVRIKYVRRAERTREILASGAPVCVVRHFFGEALEKVQAQQGEIVERLAKLYPTTRFEYLWGSEHDASALKSPFGTIHHLPKASAWQGNDAAWEKMVQSIS